MPMWNCSECGEKVETSFDICWNCQHDRGADDLDVSPEDDVRSDSTSQNVDEGNAAAFLTRPELGAIVSRTLACIIFAACAFHGLAITLIFVQAITSFPWYGLESFDVSRALWPLALVFALLVAVGIFFWLNAKRIGNKLVGGDKRQIAGLPRQLSLTFFETTIQIVGLILVVDGVRQFALIVYYAFELQLETNEYWDTVGILDVFVTLGLGFWMLLGSNGISKGIRWLRTVGTPLSINNPDDR